MIIMVVRLPSILMLSNMLQSLIPIHSRKNHLESRISDPSFQTATLTNRKSSLSSRRTFWYRHFIIILSFVVFTYQILQQFHIPALQQAIYQQKDEDSRHVTAVKLSIEATRELPQIYDQFQLPPSVEDEWSKIKLAIYMTTHLSEEQLLFLPCWNDAVQRMSIFRYADLILYTAEQPSNDTLRMLPFRNTIIKLYNNTGYQSGAIQAMKDPFLGENSTWFDEYDWVIRLNLDVLIRNDTWLIQTMLNQSIDGIFHDCMVAKAWDLIHTDFYAFRPSAVNPAALLVDNYEYAEHHITAGFANIFDSGRVVFVEGGGTPVPYDCRIGGANSPVLHDHSFAIACPYYYNYTFY